MNKLICCVAVALAGVGGRAVAGIINVPGNQPTIQAGIDAAVNGDEIIVVPGTYFETINFLGKAIIVRSSGGPRVTIIDAQGAGSVVTCQSGEGPDTVLEGFTITGGLASLGGGMFNSNSSPTLKRCNFRDNQAVDLGGGSLTSAAAPRLSTAYSRIIRRACGVAGCSTASIASPS